MLSKIHSVLINQIFITLFHMSSTTDSIPAITDCSVYHERQEINIAIIVKSAKDY